MEAYSCAMPCMSQVTIINITINSNAINNNNTITFIFTPTTTPNQTTSRSSCGEYSRTTIAIPCEKKN